MNKWFKYFVVLSLIGGGFTGISLILQAVTGGQINQNAVVYIMVIIFLAVYALCIYSGFKLIENSDIGLKLAKILFAIQIPLISSKYIIYNFFSGFIIYLNYDFTNSKVSFFGRLGSAFSATIGADNASFAFGLNFVAILVLWQLLRVKSLKSR